MSNIKPFRHDLQLVFEDSFGAKGEKKIMLNKNIIIIINISGFKLNIKEFKGFFLKISKEKLGNKT